VLILEFGRKTSIRYITLDQKILSVLNAKILNVLTAVGVVGVTVVVVDWVIVVGVKEVVEVTVTVVDVIEGCHIKQLIVKFVVKERVLLR
jgi:hypothetical protein